VALRTSDRIRWACERCLKKLFRNRLHFSVSCAKAMTALTQVCNVSRKGASSRAARPACLMTTNLSQLMAMFDWSTISQAKVCTDAADRKRLAAEAMGFINLDQSANEDCRTFIVAPKMPASSQ
jgi:hypothetical protein